MSIFTLPEIEEQITAYKSAMLAIAKSQSYTIRGRTLTRADLAEIRAQLEWLNREKEKIENPTAIGGHRRTAGRVAR